MQQIIDAPITVDDSMREKLYPVQDRRQTLCKLATDICTVLEIVQYCLNRETHIEALDKRVCSTANNNRIYSG